MKRIFTFFLAILLLLTSFYGCTKPGASNTSDIQTSHITTIYSDTTAPDTTAPDTTAPGTTAPDTTAPPDPTPQNLEIIKAGIANCSIVRPANSGPEIMTAAQKLRDAIKVKTGVSLSIVIDSFVGDRNSMLILLGDTNFAETSAVAQTMRYSDSAVKVEGNKLVLAGGISTSVSLAVDKLIDNLDSYITSSSQSKSLVIPSSISLTASISGIYSALPIYMGGRLHDIYDVRDGNYLFVISNTSITQYNSYLNQLKANGYTEYTTNKMHNNLFATYINSSYIVNLQYVDFENTVRMVIEPRINLPILASQNTYTPITSSLITQIGQEYTKSDGTLEQIGMSYVIRLADGKFIVIDGGKNEERAADDIYNTLYDQAPNKNNIIIAAWIFSHPHSDHVDVLRKFAPKYGSKVSVEKFIFNMHSEAQSEESQGIIGNVYLNMNGIYKTSKFYKAHTGQVYYIANAKIEFLYTQEDLLPSPITDINGTSLVFTVEIEGQRIMFLGDATTTTSNILVKKYNSYLKSDFVQIAHHGWPGGTVELYQKIAAPIVLYPTGNKGYLDRRSLAYNAAALAFTKSKDKNGEAGQDVFVACNYIQVIPLPYKP